MFQVIMCVVHADVLNHQGNKEAEDDHVNDDDDHVNDLHYCVLLCVPQLRVRLLVTDLWQAKE